MKRIAAVDIGTNSTRLLVAGIEGNSLKPLESRMIFTRLGAGAGGGILLPEVMARTAEAVDDLYRAARAMGAGRVLAAATSAVRDASNRDDFLSLVRLKTGLEVRVLSGEEEAALSYRGVVSGLSVDRSATAVMDVGGGSTEFIWPAGDRLRFASINAGAVRSTEAGAGEREIAGCLGPALEDMRKTAINTLAGAGGTVTTLAAVDQKLKVYDPGLVHGYVLTVQSVRNILLMLKALPAEERERVPGLQPERADIIVAGTTIVKVIMEKLGFDELAVSEWDILHGLVLEEVERKKDIYY
ncbi:MAG TPA: Ppx/GppA family phosphatase [Bacillota bacterium]|nr:Ppx/GppA family phosphatase [Bacillota bacterium]